MCQFNSLEHRANLTSCALQSSLLLSFLQNISSGPHLRVLVICAFYARGGCDQDTRRLRRTCGYALGQTAQSGKQSVPSSTEEGI